MASVGAGPRFGVVLLANRLISGRREDVGFPGDISLGGSGNRNLGISSEIHGVVVLGFGSAFSRGPVARFMVHRRDLGRGRRGEMEKDGETKGDERRKWEKRSAEGGKKERAKLASAKNKFESPF